VLTEITRRHYEDEAARELWLVLTEQ
jgi:hypothetical protein